MTEACTVMMRFSRIASVIVWFVAVMICSCAVEISYDGRALKFDGERRIILSGAIHYPRSTVEMWPDLIKKAKEGGLDAIETYVFWNAHEPARRRYDFHGNLDLMRFIKSIQAQGLFAILRIGPYVCAEWNYGGFPVWLHNLQGIQFRTVNHVFMNEMQNFTTVIVDMMKKEKLFAWQGGPIILAQIENEYGNIMGPYGDAGKEYVKWCAKMATSLNIGVPWIMCQQEDAPPPIINTCNGFYCDTFTPNNPNNPKLWTENWTGWFKTWGGKDPHRTAEDIAFAVARFFQSGGTFQNYYMYHGGTNFGRTSGGPYITTTYDYDAPLNEFGGLNQPKYGHLKQLHHVLHSIEKSLTYGNVSTADFGNNNVTLTVFDLIGNRTCFASNINSAADVSFKYQGVLLQVPAWSVSILKDCNKEIYNTAKVNTQTTVFMKEKQSNTEAENGAFKWSWRSEDVKDTVLHGKGEFKAKGLFDQKFFNDSTDYLWYMTSFKLGKHDPIWSRNMTIRVNATGQVLHGFINGEYIGTQWGNSSVFQYDFERRVVKWKHGTNQVTLLSATTGLQNYGSYFDTIPNGLHGGPVEIVGQKGDETIIKDLSHHTWSYKVGLNGIDKKPFFKDTTNNNAASGWQSDNIPINRKLTWYKASFRAPSGEEPVVVDLKGLGKGVVWVNGHNLGRYWPTFLASVDDCSADCDYRGSYTSDKCLTNCGQPTQRWYHVPRSFLKNNGMNEVILFEEFGGDPRSVAFQTVRPATVCGSAYAEQDMQLSCYGRRIAAIKYVSLGDPRGSCGSFRNGSCESNAAMAHSIVHKACVGKENCEVSASERLFGLTNCHASVEKRLVVEAICS